MNNEINVDFIKKNEITATIETMESFGVDIDKDAQAPRSYPALPEKPRINDVVLINNKTSKDLGLQDEMEALTVQEIERILYLDI